MAVSSVTSDLASLLSQYRVMAYHNMETGKDEGLVFVKKGEDQSRGELIRWTGADNTPEPGTPSTAPPSTSPPVSSPCPSKITSGYAGTTPSTSQKQYFNNNEYASVKEDYKGTLVNRSNIIHKYGAGNTSIDEDTLGNISSFEHDDEDSSVGSRINVEMKDSVESRLSRLNVVEKENNDEQKDSLGNSDVKQSKSVVRRRSNAGTQDKMPDMSYAERKRRLELYKMAGEAGWVREVVKGDRKSHTQKMRIAYLPPSHLRNIKNRLYSTVQLGVFLTTHCPDTSLTQDNFCFSAQVLGLDMPWEVVRQASLGRGVFPTKKRSRGVVSARKVVPTGKKARHAPAYSPTKATVPPAAATPCLHCHQPLPLSEAAAALHVRRCLHSKNARLRAVLEGADYSPVQHARPLQFKQRMPGKESKQVHEMKMRAVPQPQARVSLSLDSLPDCISVSKLSL